MTSSAPRQPRLRSTAVGDSAWRWPSGLSALGSATPRRQAKGSAAKAAADRAQRRAAKTASEELGKSSEQTCDRRTEYRRRRPRPRGRLPVGAAPMRWRPAATRRHARACRRRRKPPVTRPRSPPTSSTSQADTDALENVIELVRKHKPGDATQARPRSPIRSRANSPNGSSCAARTTARLGRALSRLHRRQPELAVADLPAPAHRSRAVGRPSRRRRRVGVVRGRIAACRPRARSRWPARCWRAATAPTPSVWCARPGATTPCRRTPRTPRSTLFGALLTPRRPEGADGSLLYGSDHEAALRAAKRLGAGEVVLAKARIAAVRKAPNTRALLEAVPRELHGDAGYIFSKIQLLRREEKFAEAAQLMLTRRKTRPGSTISTNGGSSGGCSRAR